MKLEKQVLDNGLRILFEENPEAKSCYMGIWVQSGSRYENDRTSGISHFIEHMVFKGTQTRSAQDIAQESDLMGGALNAYTDKEITCFYSRALKEDAVHALDIICDMLKNPSLDENDIETEKGVVKEEIAMYESSPTDLCMDLFYYNTFSSSPLGRYVLGTRETVSSFTSEMIREHMKRYYAPNRMVICFTGAFNRDEMINKCKEYFGDMERGEETFCMPEEFFEQKIVTVDKDFEQNSILIGFPSVSMTDERVYAFRLMASMLGGATSSRLFRKVREEKGLVYSIDSFLTSFINTGIFKITFSVSKENEEEAVETALSVIKDFPYTVTQNELELARKQYLACLIMSLESSGARSNKYGTSQILLNKDFDEDELVRKINAVTLDDIKKAAMTITDFTKASVCAVGDTAGDKFYNKVVRNQK